MSDEEADGKDEREEWLKRNPKMASIISDSNPQQLDSEDSAANSDDGEKSEAAPTKSEAEAAPSKTDVETNGSDAIEPPSDSSATANDLSAADQTSTLNQTGASDLSATCEDDSTVPGVGKDENDDGAADAKSDKDASDIPKGLRSSNQPKLKGLNSRPAGLTAAAASSSKGVPKGLSRGNARSASSTFHGGARSQQSASKLIAETFAKHNKPDAGSSHNKESGPDPSQRNAILTNTNFKLVDRSKRVISDD